MTSRFLYNPFEKIAGYASLALGVVFLLLGQFLSYYTGTHNKGLLFISFAKDAPFWYYMAENVIHWIVLSLCLFGIGSVISASRIRIVDVLGTTLIARIPLILVSLLRLIPAFQSFVSMSYEMFFLYGIHYLSLVWVVVLLYNATNVSCNIKEGKLILSLIVSLIISEIVTFTTIYSLL